MTMVSVKCLSLCSVLGAVLSIAAPASVVYVNASATGANTGTAWTNALTSLQSALDTAAVGDEIWVAAGIYKPSAEVGGTGSQYRAFQLKNGVGVYGGFAGTETSRDQRDWQLNQTILSGDLNGDDNDNITPGEPTRQDNCYHVFHHPEGLNLDAAAILDGCIITAGNSPDNGGAMLNFSSSPAIAHCTFNRNAATSYGGAITNYNGSNPAITSCLFTSNTSNDGGALFNGTGTSPEINHCIFSSNSAANNGGAMRNSAAYPTIENCIFIENSAATSGGAIYNYNVGSGTSSVINCTFSANSAKDGGGIYNYYYSSPILSNCTFSANSATSYGGGSYSGSNSTPAITHCIFWANTAASGKQIYKTSNSTPVVSYCDVQSGWTGTGNINLDPRFVDAANGDLRLQIGSPCIDKGNNASIPAGITWDITGSARIIDGNCDGTAIVDMGVYEFYQFLADLNSSCTVDTADLDLFAARWLDSNCQPGTNCSGADFNRDGTVTLPDFAILAEQWLK